MALGSSAPEILLTIIETVSTLGEKPGELGIFAIVGSGAYNLMVISAVSILSVEEVKKIYDLGVFFITATFSLLAYLWMYFCLVDNEISVTEAWLTFFYFFLLVGMAYGADRIKSCLERRKLTHK